MGAQATRSILPDGAGAASIRFPQLRARLADPLVQKVEELLARQRRRDQVALTEIAAHRHEGLQIGLAFDAFGSRRAAEAMRKIDGSLADRPIGGVDRAVLHEAAIKLDLDKSQLAQAGKR